MNGSNARPVMNRWSRDGRFNRRPAALWGPAGRPGLSLLRGR